MEQSFPDLDKSTSDAYVPNGDLEERNASEWTRTRRISDEMSHNLNPKYKNAKINPINGCPGAVYK